MKIEIEIRNFNEQEIKYSIITHIQEMAEEEIKNV